MLPSSSALIWTSVVSFVGIRVDFVPLTEHSSFMCVIGNCCHRPHECIIAQKATKEKQCLMWVRSSFVSCLCRTSLWTNGYVEINWIQLKLVFQTLELTNIDIKELDQWNDHMEMLWETIQFICLASRFNQAILSVYPN